MDEDMRFCFEFKVSQTTLRLRRAGLHPSNYFQNLSEVGAQLLARAVEPLATVVIGGIVSSTLLTLLLLPLLYEWVEKRFRPDASNGAVETGQPGAPAEPKPPESSH